MQYIEGDITSTPQVIAVPQKYPDNERFPNYEVQVWTEGEYQAQLFLKIVSPTREKVEAAHNAIPDEKFEHYPREDQIEEFLSNKVRTLVENYNNIVNSVLACNTDSLRFPQVSYEGDKQKSFDIRIQFDSYSRPLESNVDAVLEQIIPQLKHLQ